MFGSDKISTDDEIEPNFLKTQYFSNPFKNIYYNHIKRENLNSLESVSAFLKKFETQVNLLKGDSRQNLEKVYLKEVDYVFLDGGHSYDTVISDLSILHKGLKKNSTILCDDYSHSFSIQEVTRAINDFTKENNLQVKILANRFAEIINF